VSFELVYGDRELMLQLHFEGHIEERLLELIRRADCFSPPHQARSDLANRIVEGITMAVEGTELPPTEKQIKYAVAIARELSLQIPAQVLQFREAMTTFLGKYAEEYRRRKGYSPKTGRGDEERPGLE
jgi:hypothetical protein